MSRSKIERQQVTTVTKIDDSYVRLGGIAEVATELGVAPTRVTTWRNRGRIVSDAAPPEPLFQFAMGPVFDLDEWRTWYGIPALTEQDILGIKAEQVRQG